MWPFRPLQTLFAAPASMPDRPWLQKWRVLRGRLGLNERRCASCLEVFSTDGFSADNSIFFCPDCRERLPRRLAGYCPHCGTITEPANATPVSCGHCYSAPPPWAEFRFYGLFEGQLRTLLHRAKFSSDAACLNGLGSLLIDICDDLPRPDAIIPMPLHSTRLRWRGYNQCHEIALPLASRWRVPIRDHWLVRSRKTPPQTGMPRKDRLANLKDAFSTTPQASAALMGSSVLLVDDICTTGSSLRACAMALHSAGVARVDVAVVAVVPRNHIFPERNLSGMDKQAF